MSSNDGKHAPIKSEVQGNATGGAHWDDGPNYNGIRKVYVTCTYEKTHLRSMDIDYDKNGQVETIRHGMKNGETQEFVVDFPNEYLTSVEGTYNHVHEGNYLALTSLTFKTSKGRSSQTFGLVTGTKFVFESLGNVITGFHGSCGGSFDSLGVYFSPMLPALPPSGINSGGAALIKSELQGNAAGGVSWDDGPNYNGVRKVYVTRTYEKTHLRSMDIDYDKNGQVETIRHGMKNGETEEFSVDFPNEYITSVEGTYNHVHEGNYLVLTSLTFKTSKGRSSQTFGLVSGTKFVFERPGSVIIGFHGSCGGSFDSLGVYFSPNSEGAAASGGSSSGGTSTDSSPQKVEAQGGNGGNQWDDGNEHDGVTKIHVAVGGLGIELIKFDYLKNGQPKEGPSHGVKGVRVVVETIEIDHPNEYLISVEGWYSNDMIEGIQFKTNTRTIQYFGYQEGKHFSLEVKDKKIVGFHGFSDSRLNSIGAYFAPIATTITPLKPAKKLNAIGGNGGASWDDGAFDGVQKIFVGQGNDGVAFLMVEYNKGSQVILGDGRGKKTALGTETFELDYPSEYIISVEGYYDKLYGVEAEVVTSLTFKTNKRTSPPFGLTAGEHFEFKDEGNKIVGFHGKAGDYVHQIGVYVAPITTN